MKSPHEVRRSPHLQLFGDMEKEALRRLAGSLERAACWSDWASTLPVVQGVQEVLSDIEQQHLRMSALIPHLAQVCWRPRSSLRTEEERLPVARARRIPERAAAVLLAHPEDWAGRTLRTVQAARVLSTVVEEDWSIYENRLTLQLLHHLLRWYARNLDWVRRIKRMEREASDFSGEAGGYHWRSHRMYSLWGALAEDGELSRRTTQLLASLERERLRLLGLIDSPLSRNLKGSGTGDLPLRPTNILSHDPNYRKVAALYRVWAAASCRLRETEQEKAQQQEQAAQDFCTFALLLVLQALSSLGCRPRTDAPCSLTDGYLLLDGPVGSWGVRWSPAGMSLEVASTSLQISVIHGILTGERAAGWWSLEQSNNAGEVLLLLMGSPELAQSPLLDPSVARVLCGWSWPRVQLVSPWSLDSVERVARVLRGWEVQQRLRFESLPSKTPLGLELDAPWLVSDRKVGLRYPPDKAEYQKAVRWLQEQSLPGKEPRQDPQKKDHWKRRQQELDLLRAELARCEEHLFWTWRLCPVCSSEKTLANALDTGKGGPSWRCNCPACGSEWGVLRCGTCGDTFPVLKPPSFEEYKGQTLLPWRSDQFWGRDMWTEPRITSRGPELSCSRCHNQNHVFR